MNYIKRYKIFESNIDEEFEYSWKDINEALLHLTDMGFELKSNVDKKMYFLDKEGNEVNPDSWGNKNKVSDIKRIKRVVYEISLFKPKSGGRIIRNINLGYGKSECRFLDKDADAVFEVYQEAIAFCGHFDEAYHNVTIKNDGYHVWFVVYSDIGDNYITSRVNKEIDSLADSTIQTHVRSVLNIFSSEDKSYSKKFRESFFGSKLVNFKNGIAIQLFNWNSVTKGVYNTNSSEFESDINRALKKINGMDSWNFGRFGYKAEFRDIKPEDIAGLKVDDWKFEEGQKYIGSKAIIIKFNYDTTFKKIKNEILESHS